MDPNEIVQEAIPIGSLHGLQSPSKECWECIDSCIECIECLEETVTHLEDEIDINAHQEASGCCISSDSLDDNMVLRNSSNNPRMRRRQNPTSRKKSSAVSNVKTRTSVNKTVEKCGTSATTKISPHSVRNNRADLLDPTVAKKKLRKGYVYEEVPADVPQSCLLGSHNGCLPSTYSDCGTQTLGSSHLFSALIEKIMNEQADFIAGATPDMPISLPSYVSRRLMFTQQVLLQQSEALDKMYKENTRLERVIKAVVSVVRKFRDEYASDLLCLRDSVKILKREFAFYQEEFVEEANKSMDNIQALKEQFQRKLEDYERKNRLLNARIELHIKEREAAEERADGYLRDIHTRDREVILANKLRDRAERKLKDSLYVANNAKCAHCQISEKMRTHLTSVVAEKTIMLEKCQKECSDLHRRADQADRISQILSKDSEKLRFELNTWKSDAERNLMEISRLKEELRKSGAPPSTNSVQTQTRNKSEGITPRESPLHSNSPTPRIPTGKATPNDYAVNTPSDSTTKEQADAQRLSRPPESHIMPTPPEEPDSPRLPRERKVECSPKASFFSAPSSSVRHVHPTIVGWRNTPSNELVLRDRSASRLDGRAASPPSLIESDKNDVSKHGEVVEEQISRKSRAKEFSGVSDGSKGSHRNGRSSRSKERQESSRSHRMRESRSPSYNDNHQVRSPLPRSVSRESRKRRSSRSSHCDRNEPAHLFTNSCDVPFNGPISLSDDGSSSCRTPVQYSPQTKRFNFSSSPLPWHRSESSDQFNNRSRAYELPPSPAYHCDNTEFYDRNYFHSRSTTHRPRKNFWEQ